MASNNTIVKTFKVLDLISESSTHLTATEISNMLEMPISSTHDILKTLLDENVIYYKNYKSKTYAIGVRIYALSKSYIHDSNIINVSSPYIKEICDKYSLCGYVLKPIYKNMIVTYKYESSNSIIKIPDIGFEFQKTVYEEYGVYEEEANINEYISSIAIPIFDYSENVIGEIKIIGLKIQIESCKESLKKELKLCIKKISKGLGSKSF